MKLTSIISIAFIATVFATAALPAHGVEVSRKITKNSSSAEAAAIVNKFGNITVKHWDKKEVTVIVKITAKASDEEAARKAAQSITIEFSEADGILKAVTKRPNMINNNKTELTTDYEITLPATYPLSLEQEFGNIAFPPTLQQGKTEIDVEYGNIVGGNFGGALDVDIRYGNFSIENIDKANISCGYSKSNSIKRGNVIDIDLEYSSLAINAAGAIDADMGYSDVEIGDISVLKSSAKFSKITVGTLRKSLTVDELGYSTLTLKGTTANVKSITVLDADYSKINLKLESIPKLWLDMGNERFSGYDITENIKSKTVYGSTPVKIRGNYTHIKLD